MGVQHASSWIEDYLNRPEPTVNCLYKPLRDIARQKQREQKRNGTFVEHTAKTPKVFASRVKVDIRLVRSH